MCSNISQGTPLLLTMFDKIDPSYFSILINNLLLIITTILGSLSLKIASRIGEGYDTKPVELTHKIFFVCAIAYTCFSLYSLDLFVFYSLSAIVGDIFFLYASLLVIQLACYGWAVKAFNLIARYQLLFIASLLGLFLGTEQASWGAILRVSITVIGGSSGYLIASILFLRHWKTLNIGKKLIAISFIYVPLMALFIGSFASPDTSTYLTSAFILITQLPAMIGLLIGSLLNMMIQVNQSLESFSMTDWLTKLYNRRYFFSKAPKLIELATRRQETCCILMIDIDNFKQINDKHGHNIGDEVLCFVADIMRGTIRNSDMALRYGGEEFVVFMPMEQLTGALNLAERLRLSVAQGKDSLPPTSISVGVHEISMVESLEQALIEADHQLYRAKRTGKNKVVG